MTKSDPGRFFEDFELGQTIEHPTPRTITAGDAALYVALCGSRFALQCSDTFARLAGYDQAPVHDLLVFNMVFGKTVPDISSNSIANLGYAECDFLAQVYVGETLGARSEVIGRKENSSGKSGIVWVRTEGLDRRGVPILRFVRSVMVPKRDPKAKSGPAVVPELSSVVEPLTVPRQRLNRQWDVALSGGPWLWDDYRAGEKIDHRDGLTVEEGEHMMASRLYQSTSRVHFDARAAEDSVYGRRVVYGGHVLSLIRALSFNGLANACIISAIHNGRHLNPVFAGDTVYAWTEVKQVQALEGRQDIGALRLRSVGVKNRPAADFPETGEDVVVELDYTVILPRRR